jgi:hypothetical protein
LFLQLEAWLFSLCPFSPASNLIAMLKNNRKGRVTTLSKALLTAGLCASKQRFRMAKILAIAALTGIAALSPQASMALTISPEVKLKLERTNPPEAIPFTDEFELYITYDLDSFGSTSGLTPVPRSPTPVEQPGGSSYNFQGYNIISVRGTYTNPPSLGGERYTVPLQAPAPIGSAVTNFPSSGPPGSNTLPADTTPTTWSAFWPLGTLGQTNPCPGPPFGVSGPCPTDPYYYPNDLTAHGVTDNLYNPNGGFTPGDPGFPGGRDNGLLSYGGLLFFVDYGVDYAAEGYPNQYLPYQVFFRSLLANDPDGEDYGGCPGDCGKVKLTVETPGPLPLLGVGAAFGFSRNLRKRIKGNKSPEAMSALG